MPIEATLVADTDNERNKNSVSVWISGKKVGHLSREDAATIRGGLIKLQRTSKTAVALPGVIAGGGPGRPSFGVFLTYDPGAFGIQVPGRPDGERTGTSGNRVIRTGWSDALADDEEDDDYDLSWQGRLPEDRLKAMAFLRRELAEEADPISRHFMFAQLESLLYGARDELPDALTEYDAICESHHGDMGENSTRFDRDVRRPSTLETYKQASIRHQKAQDWSNGLRWARAGIDTYGGDTLRPEFVDDLEKRAATFQAKLETPVATPRQRGPRQIRRRPSSRWCAVHVA